MNKAVDDAGDTQPVIISFGSDPMGTPVNVKEAALTARSWPFEEARKLVERFKDNPPKKGYCLFETGYGPSGLPHIGTFGEVARTTMVMRAFQEISDIPVKLICVSDDMDGLRKVPDNLPNQGMLTRHLGKPLTQVPDPFETHESYAHHMNAKLRAFLDEFGFDYEFKSATDLYQSGDYNAALNNVLQHYDEIKDYMLTTLGQNREKMAEGGEDRRDTYSPILPISPISGRVLEKGMKSVDAEAGTITFDDEEGTEHTVPVTGGTCKLQWKPDFGMRWSALDVDFEMYGKDHLANGPVYSRICEILGSPAPQQYSYELFLDKDNHKISKSKGNGISIEEWLQYAPTESLALYMFQSPGSAKRLHFDVIPKAMDEYLTFLEKYPTQPIGMQLENPVWHIHGGNPPAPEKTGISFSLLLNLAAACNPEDKSVLWGFISQYQPDASPEKFPILDKMTDCAINYYNDHIKPLKQYREPDEKETIALQKLAELLKEKGAPEDIQPMTRKKKDSDEIEQYMPGYAEWLQQLVFDAGHAAGYDQKSMKDWFKAQYEVLLGQEQGPRMGSFIALYGRDKAVTLIDSALKGELVATNWQNTVDGQPRGGGWAKAVGGDRK